MCYLVIFLLMVHIFLSGAPEFTPGFSGVLVTQSLVLCVCFVDVVCPFVLFLLAIVLSVLRYTDSDCHFGIFKLFLVSQWARLYVFE